MIKLHVVDKISIKLICRFAFTDTPIKQSIMFSRKINICRGAFHRGGSTFHTNIFYVTLTFLVNTITNKENNDKNLIVNG